MEATGLLGVADHPALELLNSTSDATGEHLDVLVDGRGLLLWLVRSGLLEEGEAARLRRRFPAGDLDAAAAEARGFRDALRGVVEAWSVDGVPPRDGLVRGINQLLARERRGVRLVAGAAPAVLEVREWPSAAALLAMPAAAAADLFVSGEPGLVRRCGGTACTLWFYDRTKNHRRRWCSMAGCGNREKARAFRARNAG